MIKKRYLLLIFFVLALYVPTLMEMLSDHTKAWSTIPLYGGGAIMSVTVDPSSPNIIYAASDLSGPYKSIDFGNSWKSIRTGLKNEADWNVAMLAINPKNHSQIFMGTGEVFDHPSGDYGGLFRSNDAGQSWNLVTRSLKFSGHGDTRQFGDDLIIFDKKNDNIMYAATILDGIFKSIDGGENWSYIGLSGLYLTGVTMNDDNVIFVSVATREKASENDSGIYESSDEGSTWNKIFNGSVQKLVVHDDTIYTIVSGSGIYRSRDRGISWITINNGVSIASIASITGLTIDPSNPNILYVVSSKWSKPLTSIYKTTNGGDFWKNIPDQESNINIINLWDKDLARFASGAHSITVDPTNSNRIYLADSYTVWKSSNSGDTWSTNANGLETTVTNVIKAHPSIHGFVVIGSNDVLGAISKDGGTTAENLWGWKKGNIVDSDIWDIGYINSNTNVWRAVIFVSTGRDGSGYLWKSLNGGSDWGMVSSLPSPGEKKAVAIDQTNPDIIYVSASNNDIYKSMNNGKSWEHLTKGLPPKNSDIIKIIIDPKNSLNLYALDTKYGIYRSTDGGSSFLLSNKGIPNLEPNDFKCLAIDPNNPNIIYGGGENYGIYKSIDSGDNWNMVFSNFSCGGIFVSPINSAVYIGGMAKWWSSTQTGLFVSKNEGNNWSQLGDMVNNIPLPYILSIEEDPFNAGNIYVGTEGGGNYKFHD